MSCKALEIGDGDDDDDDLQSCLALSNLSGQV